MSKGSEQPPTTKSEDGIGISSRVVEEVPAASPRAKSPIALLEDSVSSAILKSVEP